VVVNNEHQRQLAAPPQVVGRLIDGLAGPEDRLWPTEQWPAMRFDRPLGVGASGGHGPVRYHVEAYIPGEVIRFRFRAPTGFDGYHEYAVVPLPNSGTLVRHRLVMATTGPARLSWPLLYRPLHDALIEDSLDKASRSLGLAITKPRRWSWRVRLLRTAVRAARRRATA
jgi:hypothetical protein